MSWVIVFCWSDLYYYDMEWEKMIDLETKIKSNLYELHKITDFLMERRKSISELIENMEHDLKLLKDEYNSVKCQIDSLNCATVQMNNDLNIIEKL